MATINTDKLVQAVRSARALHPDQVSKAAFHREACRVLRLVGQELAPGDFDVRSQKGGPGVLGECVLHTPEFYLQVCPFGPEWVMFRRCEGRKDFTGGPNNWCGLEVLRDPNALQRRYAAWPSGKAVQP